MERERGERERGKEGEEGERGGERERERERRERERGGGGGRERGREGERGKEREGGREGERERDRDVADGTILLVSIILLSAIIKLLPLSVPAIAMHPGLPAMYRAHNLYSCVTFVGLGHKFAVKLIELITSDSLKPLMWSPQPYTIP